MLSTLTFTKEKIPVADYSKESSLPSLNKIGNKIVGYRSELDEDDNLFVGFGDVRDIFPYRMQDLYTRDRKLIDLEVAVLENKYIKATFAPTLGGKLLSLIDKTQNRDLLFKNPVIQPCNLALRNAWTSGGVEWNIGMVGHSPFTCSTMHTVSLKATDGTPILRMYEYERIRKVTYQMDFYIPKNSKFLHCRIRIVNQNDSMVPMYWWSNMAVPEDKNSRVITSANCAYTSEIINGERVVMKLPIPFCDGFDATYPTNTLDRSRDYFYRTDDSKPRYIAYVDKDGYGLLQTSTSRLKGRKLFVWGQGPGAKHWQDFLSLPGKGGYVEIQAGLARSQYEHIPMPPNTAWEWIEVYGAISCKAGKVHSDYKSAQAEIEKRLNSLISIPNLETELKETKSDFVLKKAEERHHYGSAWGKLENALRKSEKRPLLSEHLDFGRIGKEQSAWNSLLKEGTVGVHNPKNTVLSWMLQDEFTALLESAVEAKDADNWYAWLQLGAIYLCMDKFKKAEIALLKSIKLEKNAWAYYCLAVLNMYLKNFDEAKKNALAAINEKDDDLSLSKAIFTMLNNCSEYSAVKRLYEAANHEIKNDSRAKTAYIYALAHSDDLETALHMLMENGGHILNDVKEEEVILSDLFVYCVKGIADKNGEKLKDIEVPLIIDFRVKPEKYTFR
ncbi:MAG: DUF5107 domain-containing protein [Ruminococcaceae bacterium]|nr:DUF5107 domain-containing protein [Oscillospiraceae bacterium]